LSSGGKIVAPRFETFATISDIADIRAGPAFVRSWTIADIAGFWLGDGLSAYDPGRVKTRSVLFVGGVSGDPGGIVRLGAANSAELVRADA
jgi:hypothetical protein